MLYLYQRLFYGQRQETDQFKDLDLRETLIGGTFAVIILVLGILPMTILRSMEPQIEQLGAAASSAQAYSQPIHLDAVKESVKLP